MFRKASSMDENTIKTKFEDGDEIELELCLSLGGSFKKTENSAPIENRTDGKRDEQTIFGDGIPKSFDAGLGGGACVDSLSKREIHALRRQEARKKREAKMQLQRRGSCPNGGVLNRGGALAGAGEQHCKRIKTECNGHVSGKTNGLNLNFGTEQNGNNQNACSVRSPASRVQHPDPYLCPYPYPRRSVSSFGNSNANLTSFFTGGNDAKPKNAFQPHGEDHQPVTEGNGGNGYGSGQVEENEKLVSNGSPVCSSSGVSDPNTSSPRDGSSCDSRTNSSQAGPDKRPPINNTTNGQDETEESTDGSNATVVPETPAEASNLSRRNYVARTEDGKPPKPQQNGNGSNGSNSFLPFPQMPCVTATGNGPDGKTVNGILYRYSKSEISIVCVCHGRSFSPAEFVRHAGGIAVSHPLRHITVIPSAF